MRIRRIVRMLSLLSAAALAVGACGGSSGEEGSSERPGRRSQDRPQLAASSAQGPARDRHLETLAPDFDPVPWEDPPPRPALEGPLAANTLLTDAQILGEPDLLGAEDVAVGLDGSIYSGTRDGDFWRIPVGSEQEFGRLERVANLGGPVLGIAAYDERELVAAVAGRGLVAVDSRTGNVKVLSDRIGGNLIYFPDGVDVARDGSIYFTEASTRYYPGFPLDFFDGRPAGRLLRYEPSTRETEVIADRMHFANGVVVAPDESYALVAESFRFRITRVSLAPNDFGSTDTFAELVNGADNLKFDAEGRLWVGGSALRNDVVDQVLRSADLRRQLSGLTREQLDSMQSPYGFVQVLDSAGEPVFSFHDATGRYFGVSAGLAHDGYAYFATLSDRGVARVPLPPELAG